MEITQLNRNQIVSIRKKIGYYSTWYEYKTKKTFFGFTIHKEGYYFTCTMGSPEYRTIEEIEESGIYFCKDKRVYIKPHVEIRMSNDSKFEKYFETELELDEFMNSDLIDGIEFVPVNIL